MESRNWKKIRIIESILFPAGWILILLAGADFPPPRGFYRLVILIILLDLVQQLYLRWLCKNLIMRRTFLLNELLFLAAGVVVAVLFVLCNGGFQKESGIWTGVIAAVSVVYGTAFWIIHRLLAGKIRKSDV
ncbi:MAG TPA: hypothetical protein DCZ61_00135 [Lachnospiraceae bacterium]|nr:hypothetical protein [Lachnospiraceae bacterium]